MAHTPRDEQLIQDLTFIKETMISVATHGEQIQDVNDDFRRMYARAVATLARRKIENPLTFGDLWEWYARWKTGDLPTYESRRVYVRNLVDPLIRKLQSGREEEFTPTGWSRVDRNVEEMREVLGYASNEEQFQTVGLVGREALISLAQAVYDPAKHPSLETGVVISDTDAKRMLESYIAVELASESQEARAHVRSALALALKLQHSRTATFRLAAMCAEATTAVINLIAIISGQRDPRNEIM
jgi:hypothetical protein